MPKRKRYSVNVTCKIEVAGTVEVLAEDEEAAELAARAAMPAIEWSTPDGWTSDESVECEVLTPEPRAKRKGGAP